MWEDMAQVWELGRDQEPHFSSVLATHRGLCYPSPQMGCGHHQGTCSPGAEQKTH